MDKLSTDNLLCLLRESFSDIKDKRRNNSTISLVDAMMSSFAMFSLKYPSLLQLEQRSPTESDNIGRIYQIGRIPSDTQMRSILDGVAPSSVLNAFCNVHSQLTDLLPSYGFKIKTENKVCSYFIVSVDGVEFFSSPSVHCPFCLSRTHGNGKTGYCHQMLCAALVCPNKDTVFPLWAEPISQQDGACKNDCERNSAKRLLATFPSLLPADRCLFVEDALYANGPHLGQVLSRGSHFMCRIKADGNPGLFRILEEYTRVKEYKVHRTKYRYGFRYINNVPLNNTHPEIRVNLLWVEQVDRKTGQKKVFSWATDLPIHRSNLMDLMEAGRARWKIENEVFNTLKNQGYAFEHNYGHGKQHLSNTLAMIMLLAFLIDQIQQAACQNFQKVLERVGSKVRLWQQMRGAVFYLNCQNYEHLILRIAENHSIKLE